MAQFVAQSIVAHFPPLPSFRLLARQNKRSGRLVMGYMGCISPDLRQTPPPWHQSRWCRSATVQGMSSQPSCHLIWPADQYVVRMTQAANGRATRALVNRFLACVLWA